MIASIFLFYFVSQASSAQRHDDVYRKSLDLCFSDIQENGVVYGIFGPVKAFQPEFGQTDEAFSCAAL